jgi:hypothetical protein
MLTPTGRLSPFPREKFLEFCSRIYIQTKDFGLVPLQLLGTQTHVLDEMCAAIERGVSNFMILKARQLGMTTFFIVVDLFWCFEHAGMLGSFVTHTDQAKANFRNMIKLIFHKLPRTHRVKWDQENRDMIVLRNNSVLQYLVAGTKDKVKGGLGRSSANNFIHATEVAFWGAPDDLNELAATMSTHHPHRLKIEETTANGFNFWEERWREGKNDPTVCCIFVGWWRHDHYRYEEGSEKFDQYMPKGRNGPWTRLERMRANDVARRYGYSVTPEQLAWYRWKLESELFNDQGKMDEMYPWVEEDAFVATGTQFFASRQITETMRAARQRPFMPYKYEFGEHWRDTVVTNVNRRNAELRVWEEADANGHYVIGCDPAYGSGPDADQSAICVCRAYADKLVQVAEFATPIVSTYQCAWALAHIGGYYRNFTYNLEISGPGEAVQNEIQLLKREASKMFDRTADGKIDYDLRFVLTLMRQFLYTRIDTLTQTAALHTKTNQMNKFASFAGLKDSFDQGKLILRSMPLLEEMRYVKIDGGSIAAEAGKKDDRVMALALAHETWRKWVRDRLSTIGLTYALEQAKAEGRGPSQLQTMAINYMHGQGMMSRRS